MVGGILAFGVAGGVTTGGGTTTTGGGGVTTPVPVDPVPVFGGMVDPVPVLPLPVVGGVVVDPVPVLPLPVAGGFIAMSSESDLIPRFVNIFDILGKRPIFTDDVTDSVRVLFFKRSFISSTARAGL